MESLPQLPQNFWAFISLVFFGLVWVIVRPLLAKFFDLVDKVSAHQAQLQQALSNHFEHDAKAQEEIVETLQAIARKLDAS